MTTGMTCTPRSFLFRSAAVLLFLVPAHNVWAQQYLGNARQRCQGPVTVTTPGGALQVRPFEARSAEVNNSSVHWQCSDQPQPAEIQCPPNTNKVLVDRSQGGSIFSIICLQK
jgi:hypothetical protein